MSEACVRGGDGLAEASKRCTRGASTSNVQPRSRWLGRMADRGRGRRTLRSNEDSQHEVEDGGKMANQQHTAVVSESTHQREEVADASSEAPTKRGETEPVDTCDANTRMLERLDRAAGSAGGTARGSARTSACAGAGGRA
eukprot:6075472-Prymnesium_polylepis.1